MLIRNIKNEEEITNHIPLRSDERRGDHGIKFPVFQID